MIKTETQIFPQTYTYQDISMVPRHLSAFRSRSEIDLSVKTTTQSVPLIFRMPILPAPMDTICGPEMCRIFSDNGMYGMIHRFQSDDQRRTLYANLRAEGKDAIIAIGLDEEHFLKSIYADGARLFIIDVANGFNIHVEPVISTLRDFGDTFVICGNVASKEGFEYLATLGVDAIRVGIGNGSMCTTSVMTGVGQGIVSALRECVQLKKEKALRTLIIADGGVSEVGHIALALALGADLVMIGRMFAGTREAEGNILKYNGKLYKAFRGSASFAVQKKSKGNPYFVEGDETIVSYKGSVQNIFDQMEAGLRSAFSYMGAANVRQLQDHASFVCYRMDEKLFKSS
ncbi:MAG: guanosine monophosphate reductase [FCB group bacterium]|nr:guanosine monophosphate reductase [FCB group bacterium]